ncbi:MAG: hypothetical protein NC930_07455 [Candidatus Omnitrophica bacterium]|nr:hypothetical protein [Candidatus Omnitrophota bacterium]
MKRMVFWPNNPLYVLLCASVALLVPQIPILQLPFKAEVVIGFFCFLVAVYLLFFYFMRLVVDDNSVTGPVLSIFPGKISRKHMRCFFDESVMGHRHIIIRDENSGMQIQVPSILFTRSSIKKLKQLLEKK